MLIVPESMCIKVVPRRVSLLERILPWTCTGQDVRDAPYPTLRKENPAVIKTEYAQTTSTKTPVEKEVKASSVVAEQQKARLPKTIPATFENAVQENSNTPLLEMWNVLESVGIKRDNLDRIFRTDEAAVSELYSLVEKRLHYQREQDMIRRLKAHVEKIVKTKAEQKIPT